MYDSGLVSVVIPTYKRPHLITRAVDTALSQTLQDIEVVVVIDGPDPEVVGVLSQIEDPRLKVVELPQNVRLAGARNAGVKAATGTWIAFLDDDDEWMPDKLELQLAAAKNSSYEAPVVVSCFINRSASGDFVWPRRLPDGSQHLSEYMFVRSSFFQGEAVLLPSTYFVRRDIVLNTPFENNKHEDYDWLLRVTSQNQGVGVECVPKPLAIWQSDAGTGNQKRLSQIPDWRYSLEWLHSAQEMMTPRAYSSFVFSYVGPPAAAQRDWKAFGILLKEAISKGSPRPFDFMLYLAMWLVPQDIRERVRALLGRQKKPVLQPDA